MKKSLEIILKTLNETFDLQKQDTPHNNLLLYAKKNGSPGGECLIYTLGSIAALICFEVKPEGDAKIYLKPDCCVLNRFSDVSATSDSGKSMKPGNVFCLSDIANEKSLNLSDKKPLEGVAVLFNTDKYIRYINEVFNLDIEKSLSLMSNIFDFGSVPELSLISGQIRLHKVRHTGNESVLFYESKLHEILSVMMRKAAEICDGEVLKSHTGLRDENICTVSGVSSDDVLKISEITDLLNETASKKESIEDLARRACMSSAKFKYTFKQVTGRSVSEYRGRLLSEKARLLLSSTDITIKEISEQTGFKKPGSFTEFFKKQTGFNPADYRKLYRK